MATIVTCYYVLENAKHSQTEYNEWIKNLLYNINVNLLLFTCKKDRPYLESILNTCSSQLNYKIVEKELMDMDIVKKYPTIWEEQERIDPNKKCGRKSGCYIIWNSKMALLQEVIKSNPFNTEYFIWNDIGNVRDSRILPYLKTYPLVDNISKTKMDIIILRGFSNPSQLFFQDEVHFSGSMFGGHRDVLLELSRSYYELFHTYIENKKFIGCDQQIMASLHLKYPQFINPIIPRNSNVDPWFFLYEYYGKRVK